MNLDFLKRFEDRSRGLVIGGCFVFIGILGVLDFLTGSEIFFSVFYLLAVAAGTWLIGRNFGFFLSILSSTSWIVGDLAAGARYSSSFIPIWNAAILLAFYFIVVWLLSVLRALHIDLENRVMERTKDLTREMSERERLEKEILEISEREQRRIGRDLHDSLCQHFTGTALACRVLEERLAGKAASEAKDLSKIVTLVEEGVSMARALARGISPVEMEAEGLVAAFQTFAGNITKLSNVQCIFEIDQQILIRDATAATHLYRIAQEAVTNAMRHGKATRIDISLSSRAGKIVLAIEDDGVGLPDASHTDPKWQARLAAQYRRALSALMGRRILVVAMGRHTLLELIDAEQARREVLLERIEITSSLIEAQIKFLAATGQLQSTLQSTEGN